MSSLWNSTNKKNEYYSTTEHIYLSEQQAALLAIYEAVMADFEQGNLGKRYLFDLEDERQLNTCTADLTIYWREIYQSQDKRPTATAIDAATSYYNANRSMSVTLTPNAENTIRVLTELGILDEDTTLRLYRDIVDEEERVKLAYGDMDFNSAPTASAVISGYDN